MIPNACLLAVAVFGLSFQPPNEKDIGANATAGRREGPAITVEEIRPALKKMIEADSFLADTPSLAPLKERIRAESKKESLLTVGMSSSAPGGDFLGPWEYNKKTNEFAYIAKSAGRNELFTIRGHFLLGKDKKWIAKINAVSATKLTNYFGPREYKEIKAGMTKHEVIKILGAPPGAYFTGEMGFMYPGVRRKCPFTGTGKDFKELQPEFFASNPDPDKDSFQRAWISNDVAIWLYFDTDWKVVRVHTSEVKCPNEWRTDYGQLFDKLKQDLREKK